MAETDNKILNGEGLSHLSSKIKEYISEQEEVYIGTTEPTGDEKIWINPDGEESPVATKDYVDGEIERVEGEIPSLDGYATEEYVDDAVSEKSAVSVSDTGTATDEVQYITIDGVEKKLAGGGGVDIIELQEKKPRVPYTLTDEEFSKCKPRSWIYYPQANSLNKYWYFVGENSSAYVYAQASVTQLNRIMQQALWVNKANKLLTGMYDLFNQEVVSANPDNPTQTLSSIKIGDIDYSVGGGGGGDYLPLSGGTLTGNLSFATEGHETKSPIQFKTVYNSGPQSHNLEIYSSGVKRCTFMNNGISIDTSIFPPTVSGGTVDLGRNTGPNYFAFRDLYLTGNIIKNATTSASVDNIIQAANSIPAPPLSDGEYNLHCSIVNGVPTYTWKAEV